MKKITVAVVILMVLGCAFVLVAQQNRTAAAADEPASAPAQPAPSAAPVNAPASAGIAEAAIKKAADDKKYLFLFVSEGDNAETATAKQAVEAAATKIADKAEVAFIKRDDAAEKATVDKLQLSRAPMPIVLAMAPNGSITGAFFADKLKDPQLQEAIASDSEQKCMKALQDGKLVFVCAQNAATKSNDAAMKGINDFKADTRFAQFTEVVTIDPTAAGDQPFLTKLKLDPKMTEATTAFIAPPGSIVSKINGATSKDALVAALTAASSGGCGAGGCGPKGCGPRR
jgi:hypothetical protein